MFSLFKKEFRGTVGLFHTLVTGFLFALLPAHVAHAAGNAPLALPSAEAYHAEQAKAQLEKQFVNTYKSLHLGLGETPESKLVRSQATKVPYSVNVMWINNPTRRNVGDTAYVFPEEHWKHIQAWAEKNPEAMVNVWFDSLFVSKESETNTEKRFRELNLQGHGATLVLRDVRDLPLVQEHPDLFSKKTYTYFRADLLRVVATVHTVEQEGPDHTFVYADMDVTPMLQKELFDEQTLQALNTYGIVLTEKRGTLSGYENSFHMVRGDHPYVLQALQQGLVAPILQFAQNTKGSGENVGIWAVSERTLLSPVYSGYRKMLQFLFALCEKGKLLVVKDVWDQKGEDYDIKKHGLSPFLSEWKETGHKLCFQPEDGKRMPFPTKKIKIPKEGGIYY